MTGGTILMKKLLTLMLALVMAVSAVGFAAANNPYEVTEPITIQWWRAPDAQLTLLLTSMVDRLNSEPP